MAYDPALNDHKAWLGYLQPEGLVVSAAALVDAQVVLDRNATELQQRFLEYVEEVEAGEETVAAIVGFPRFAREFLGWPDECLLGLEPSRPVPDSLVVPLPDLNEILSPTLAFVDACEEGGVPLLLAKEIAPSTSLDAATTGDQAGWSASASQRFERLLRETGVAIGVLSNGSHLRLIYAPRGESAGSLTWPIIHLTEVAGRPLVGALQMLLSAGRLLTGEPRDRLPALLARSRDYQSQVSTALAGQVLDALYELLRGFQAADAATSGELLRDVLADQPDTVYAGLLAVLMRLVFLLYAEDRGLMPGSPLYVRNYSVHGLFERLRADRERYPDTMDQRYGGWAQLVALFRAVHSGCRHPELAMPPREGHLFDPERYPFLDGATLAEPQLPRLSDGYLERVLRNLLILNGERLSYRTLDVEEIGSVYQTIMGFALERVAGTSIAIVGKRKHKSEVAAPVVVNLEALLGIAPNERGKWLKERTGHDWDNEAGKAVKGAATVDGLLIAVQRRIASHATPAPVPAGGLVLQPTDERRRTGSHYTPRKLTAPIVRKTLEPVLAQLGAHPTPAQILDLKVCDPAMGSGAFLVEACRQLADVLVDAWHHHGQMPLVPLDEDELMLAKRLIAQRCLYGVDKNPMAVNLAKLSLWLATLAKDHPFTFVDHALRPGDSLVGLTVAQIKGFHWQPTGQRAFGQQHLEERIAKAVTHRHRVLLAGDTMPPAQKQQELRLADDALEAVRFYGDLVIAAFFSAGKDKDRQARRNELLEAVVTTLETGDLRHLPTAARAELRSGEHPVTPFHWEIEFPEVFQRERGGFDAIVGNPPFLGGTRISSSSREAYLPFLTRINPESGDRADLVAYFFRRAFALIREQGTFGLLATNTIAQGDTRHAGLCWIRRQGGRIYSALQRYRWPGEAAVVVSVVHIRKGPWATTCSLNGAEVPEITGFLLHQGGDNDPVRLAANKDRAFEGLVPYGAGFLFCDDTRGAHPVSLMAALIAANSRNAEVIRPYLGGEELNDDPEIRHRRYVIYFGTLDEAAVRTTWPELYDLLRATVKPERESKSERVARSPWWQFLWPRPDLMARLQDFQRVLACSKVSKHLAFAFVDSGIIMSNRLAVLTMDALGAFSLVQTRPHELWARTFGYTLEDRPAYAPTDGFDTFPFPRHWETNAALEAIGQEYYAFRADLMVRHDEGLTKTYNRFHDPDERDPDILRLRELHAEMDRAVLDAYGWTDLPTACEFLLEYEDEEDDEDVGRTRRRKKPWRYRWPDEVRDEVLARLLALNAERAEEERLAGLAAGGKKGSTAKKGGRGKQQTDGGLFGDGG